ncbi:hypothetical protein H1R20_g9381, partial [Candolleomyces eurysporus]
MSAVIPTIAYQLGSSKPALREAISAAVTKDPLIFEKSLKTQMNKLIVDPIEDVSPDFSKSELAALPYAILIDGLDECAEEHRQAELLAVIDDCILENDALPFRVFIASRPEWAIRSALEVTGHLHQKAYHIQLSDRYDASGDIRRVLWRRLRDIGRRSGDPRALSPSWPSKQDIETLVANASGQFIYAATVIKFVSERRSSPVDRLQAVITWTPEDRAQPFAALDLLYTNIVSAAKEAYEAAHPDRDFLLLFSITDLEGNAHRWLISDLRSLVTIEVPRMFTFTQSSITSEELRFYHKSFTDFLGSAGRSKSLFVPEARAIEFVAVNCIRALDKDDSITSIWDFVCLLLIVFDTRLESHHDQEFHRVIQTLYDKWKPISDKTGTLLEDSSSVLPPQYDARWSVTLAYESPVKAQQTWVERIDQGCGGLQINAHQHGSNSNDPSGWERLLQNTAPNALHDSKYRFDPPKCDEDTRVEVIEELVGWIQDRESPQRLLCMTGAAGSGKSALQQTVAEKCSRLNILSSTFFFSSSDPTRNTVSAVIPTIAYQLGSNNTTVREAISAAVTKDPLIFEKSLATQMNNLIVNPIEGLSQQISKSELAALPYAILIDGLDECTDEQRQAELLETIDDCLLQNDTLPFRIFIASRPEWAIRSALEDTGYLHQKAYHIQLSDQYDAGSDIRRSLWRRLREIGRRSGDPRARPPSWPSEEDIETLVANASGQFIYAATVIKFVSERRSSPVDRLRTVLTWTPEDQAQPFAALDLLYTNIVSAAKQAYEAAHPDRDFLLLLRVYQLLRSTRWTLHVVPSLAASDEIMGLEENSHRWLISDLRSLVTAEAAPPGARLYELLHFYHKSFQDFLDSASRSKSLFVPESRAAEFVIATCVGALDRHGSSNFEKLKRWEILDKRIEEQVDADSSSKPFLKPLVDGWLALLSYALLDYKRRHDQEYHQVIQTLHDKWQQICETWSDSED